MNVARAIRKDLGRADAHDELCLGIVGEQRVGVVDGCNTVQPHSLTAFEVDEEEADVLRRDEVPGRQVHPVAVIDREGDRRFVEHADEARLAALVRALRPPLLVGRRDEEHVAGLDEGSVALVDAVMNDPLLDPVGEPSRVEPVLELAAGGAVETHVPIFSGKPHEYQTFRGQDLD